MSQHEPIPQTPEARAKAAKDRVELVSTALLSVAAIFTAWCAFQGSVWSGQQAIAFNEAAAVRIEAEHAADRAGQEVGLDVNLFIAWVQAVAADVGPAELVARGYRPKPESLSTFLYERFRKEFRPAMEAWLATRPFQNPEAPASPFEMSQYRLHSSEEAVRLLETADKRSADAREFNERSDRYVAVTVLFAIVLFFAGLGPKFEARSAQRLMLGLAFAFLTVAVAVLSTFPIVGLRR